MTLTLLSYNNYYNRIVKRHETLDDYYNDGAEFSADIVGVSFNPNEGVSTSQIVNADFTTSIVPDYALLMDGNTIISRWYIIKCVRTRGGQYNLDLLRDLVADSYDKVLTAPMFIEKALLSTNDERIFNNENMTYNQIKTSETLLKNQCDVPWIVGYIAKNIKATEISVPAAELHIDYDLTALNEYPYHRYNYENPYKMSYNDFTTKMYLQSTFESAMTGWGRYGESKLPLLEVTGENVDSFPVGGRYSTHPKSGYWRAFLANWGNSMDEPLHYTTGQDWYVGSYDFTGVPTSPIDYSGEEGKIIKAGAKYYRIRYRTRVTDAETVPVNKDDIYGSRIAAVANQCVKYLDLNNTNNLDPVGAIDYKANACYFVYEEISVDAYEFEINSNRRKAYNAPYDIFAIPAASVSYTQGGITRVANGELGYKIAQQMIVNLGENLYDIQLLPYMSLPYTGNKLNLNDFTLDSDFVYAKTSSDAIGTFIYWMGDASFRKTINDVKLPIPSNAIDFKIANECDLYRIVSPTYNGEFSFSATKNYGVVSFNVYCTYKPYNPFIKIAPLFAGLYGEEFEDARGCICQGDFSLPQVTSKWVDYQINNKNFLNSFNRQIQNMERNNAVQKELEGWQVFGGVASGAASGAVAGAMTPAGGWGALAGGVIGGVSSLAGGLQDVRLNEKLRAEALDYTKDQFGYQLGNIAALPYSLANVGAQTIISKYFPMLEYYTATEIEKEALRNKIKYNGMTVMTIGTIQGFKQATPTYIKGKLIRLENAEEEFHFVRALADELYKGVFI